MIRYVDAPPGEGKTCFLVSVVLLKALREDTRPILTNLPIRLEELKSYCLREGFEPDWGRLRLLDESEISDWWKTAPNPHIAILDEAGVYWPARDYKQTSVEFQNWLRGHRHLGTDIWISSQAFEDVVTVIRRLVTERVVLQNLAHRKFGPFPGPRRFIARFYTMAAGRDKKPHSVLTYAYSKRIFETYDSYNLFGSLQNQEESKPTHASTVHHKKPGLFRRFRDWVSSNPLTVCVILFVLLPLALVLLGPSRILNLSNGFDASRFSRSKPIPKDSINEPLPRNTSNPVSRIVHSNKSNQPVITTGNRIGDFQRRPDHTSSSGD